MCTSAGIILNQELIQCGPTSSHSDHQGAAQDTDHSQLLGISKLHDNKLHFITVQQLVEALQVVFPLNLADILINL